MAIGAIQNNTNNDSHKKMSIIKSATAGALVGYSLKWALPITSQEKDERFSSEMDALSAKLKAAESKEFENIRNSKRKTVAVDTFIKMYDEKKLTDNKIKKLQEPLSSEVMDLKNSIGNKTKGIIEVGSKTIKAFTKSIRPTFTFICAGVVAGVAIALVNNISSIINENKKSNEAKKD